MLRRFTQLRDFGSRGLNESSFSWLRVAAASIFIGTSGTTCLYYHGDSIPSAKDFDSTNQILATSTDTKKSDFDKSPRLVFLGTGSSTGCPKPLCSILFPQQPSKHQSRYGDPNLEKDRLEYQGRCEISALASKGDPRHNKNYRGNPSMVISHHCDDARKNIIIDVGKTFREHAIRWMPTNDIASIDAVVLTHEHMDAMGGLDDLRGFQKILSSQIDAPPKRLSIPIYLSSNCYKAVQRQFPYLVPKEKPQVTLTPNKPIVKRDVSALVYHTVTHFEPFDAAGLKIIPLPVIHGEDFICNGYAFTITNSTTGKKSTVLYLSDMSRMPPETMNFIQNKLPPIDIFVVDSLLQHKDHPVHYSLNQAITLADEIKAKQTYIVGINCDDFPDHDIMNRKLSEKHPTIQLAHDGLSIDL